MIVETLIEMRKKWENKGIQKGIQVGRQEGIQEGMQKGIRQGIQKGRKEAILITATRLLKEGFSVESIARVTGLSLKEIEKLKKDLD